MIDLLNRIGFRQIAFGGEGGGGGGGARGMPAASNNVVKNAALRKNIMNQPHKLAYITPQEEQMLRDAGGTGQFVNGIPAFPRGSVSKAKVDKAKTKTSTKSTPAPRDDRQPVVKSTPSYDFGSSNDDNDPPPVVYTPPPVVYTPPPVVYTTPDPVYTYYDPDPTPTPDPVTVSPTDTSNVYDFYEPDPVTVSPTDTSNVYDFYEPDPVTVYDGGSNDEETVMLQPVTYTGPAVETTLDTDPVVDFSLDDLNLGTGVYEPDPVTVSPTDTSNVYDFYEPDPVVDYSPVDMDLGTGVYEPDPVVDYSPVDLDIGTGVYEPDPVTVSPTDTSNVYDFYEPDPVVDYSPVDLDIGTGVAPTVDYSLDDLDIGTGVYDPDPVDETPISVFDADMLSKVTKGLGTSTTWVGNNTQEASNVDPNNRFDFDPVGAYETETIGALPVAGGLGVSPVPRPRPDNLVMGTSPIGPTVTVSTKDALTTPKLGALPEGVTQQMITDSQNDGEYGYYNNDGSFVPANIDKYNGGGPDYSGVAFASGGGAQFDLDGDRFISKTEMGIGKAAGYELDKNFWSKAGTGLGVTPLGSGQDPTGVAKWAEKLIVPGGSTLRKLSPPAFERPLSSYDPNNPYADVGENAPNIWWEKGKTNPIGFEYKRTPDEVLADRTESREKATIDAANEITNNDNDSGPRTRREDLYGTRMTTEEYRRRYKGGGGAALPAYMRKYASGKSIDELVRKVKVNGKDYFLTPDGRYIEPSAFTGAAVARDIDVVETGESEQYLESYNVIDESTGIITTYNTDGSIMEVFDPNFESEEA
jgi:hypothetical protein